MRFIFVQFDGKNSLPQKFCFSTIPTGFSTDKPGFHPLTSPFLWAFLEVFHRLRLECRQFLPVYSISFFRDLPLIFGFLRSIYRLSRQICRFHFRHFYHRSFKGVYRHFFLLQMSQTACGFRERSAKFPSKASK